ncbi:hypothetical protein IE81DRAFT_344043 [Ceraceosorus guamensis]|uniref:Uncharacterized protein n=1 Tax=Ceraceosorus guamensis TaxID=1522189 RepID=A0A316WH96_9BASI|nr:hypothetical protein IE81DRAFT_344043 [Ceraceosorus guamensis]PWN46435.1 hypothetical protein IE81DRAFT_344043 [Ceraceosorus guamensis]
MAQLQAPAPRRPIALLRKRRTSSHQARALHSGSIADATPSSTSTGENEVRAGAQPDEEEDGENRNRPVMRQRRSASPVAGSHPALSASTNHADGTPSRHDRDRLLSVPLARSSHAAGNEGLVGTPRAPALQWVSSPIPRHWTLNPLARGRAGQEGGDEEAMMMMMPSKRDSPLDPSATPAAAALVKQL